MTRGSFFGVSRPCKLQHGEICCDWSHRDPHAFAFAALALRSFNEPDKFQLVHGNHLHHAHDRPSIVGGTRGSLAPKSLIKTDATLRATCRNQQSCMVLMHSSALSWRRRVADLGSDDWGTFHRVAIWYSATGGSHPWCLGMGTGSEGRARQGKRGTPITE